MLKKLFGLAVCAIAFNSFAVEIIAHRGASHDAPENTLASVRLGWEQKADAVEIDIYLSKDGRIVALHDKTTKRTAALDKPVAEQTLAELQTLDAGAWKASKWAGEKIPTLEEIVATIPPGKRLFIEIKCGPEVLPELRRVIGRSGKKPEHFVIIGFGYDTVVQSKKLLPNIPVYYLYGWKKEGSGTNPPLDDLIQQAKSAGLDGLNLNFGWPIDRAFVEKVKAAGLGLYVWTVNDPAVASRLADAGVDGITTDRPLWLREMLGR